MQDWSRKTLGAFVSLQRGHDLPEEQRCHGSIPILGSFGITGWHNKAKTPGPGVTVGRSGASFGVVTYSPVDYWPLNTALYVADFHGNAERFAYYFLKTFDFSGYNSGSAQPSLNRNFIHPVPVNIPPLPEQRAIAHILGTLDDKIELNRRMNETLEAMARALFQSWFVDFDPVHRNIQRAQGHTPTNSASAAFDQKALEASAKSDQESLEASAEWDALFPDAFEDSEIGPIPNGWRVGTLADYALLNPESWSKSNHPDDIAYVDLANTKWGRIESTTPYCRAHAPSRAQRILRPGDTIVGTVRPGNGSYAFISESGLTGSTGFAVLRPKVEAGAELIYLAATKSDNIDRLSHLADGGAYPAVRPEVVLNTPVPCAPGEVIECFAQIVRPIMSKMACNEAESRILAALRDTLLPRLISGGLQVQHVERFVEGGECE